jgi:hypothetical protein
MMPFKLQVNIARPITIAKPENIMLMGSMCANGGLEKQLLGICFTIKHSM